MQVTEVVQYAVDAAPEEIMSWKHDKVTREMLKLVDNEIRDYEQRIGSGETLGDNIQQDTARAIGNIDGLKFLKYVLEAKFVETEEGKDDTTS